MDTSQKPTTRPATSTFELALTKFTADAYGTAASAAVLKLITTSSNAKSASTKSSALKMASSSRSSSSVSSKAPLSTPPVAKSTSAAIINSFSGSDVPAKSIAGDAMIDTESQAEKDPSRQTNSVRKVIMVGASAGSVVIVLLAFTCYYICCRSNRPSTDSWLPIISYPRNLAVVGSPPVFQRSPSRESRCDAISELDCPEKAGEIYGAMTDPSPPMQSQLIYDKHYSHSNASSMHALEEGRPTSPSKATDKHNSFHPSDLWTPPTEPTAMWDGTVGHAPTSSPYGSPARAKTVLSASVSATW